MYKFIIIFFIFAGVCFADIELPELDCPDHDVHLDVDYTIDVNGLDDLVGLQQQFMCEPNTPQPPDHYWAGWPECKWKPNIDGGGIYGGDPNTPVDPNGLFGGAVGSLGESFDGISFDLDDLIDAAGSGSGGGGSDSGSVELMLAIPGHGDVAFTLRMLPDTATDFGAKADEVRLFLRNLISVLMSFVFIRSLWSGLENF